VEGIRAIRERIFSLPTSLVTRSNCGHYQAAWEAGAPGGEASASGRPSAARIQVSVYPTLVPHGHLLASVNHVFNAVFVRGDIVGDTLFYGRGAGKDATASAVLSDLADARWT